MAVGRAPPEQVLHALRREVNFGCPVAVSQPGEELRFCRSPYLTWHHFDPPWDKEQHHRLEGMIALCREHHDKADGGAYEVTQLHRFKELARENPSMVSGRLEWLRRDLLAVIGTNFFLRCPIVVRLRWNRIVWFNRDPDGYLLLNVNLGQTRVRDNVWTSDGAATKIVCPPQGKRVEIESENGDRLQIRFRPFDTREAIEKAYLPRGLPAPQEIPCPITAVEVGLWMPRYEVSIDEKSAMYETSGFIGCFASGRDVGLQLGDRPPNDRLSVGFAVNPPGGSQPRGQS